jgi:hypothetical protein
MWMRVPTAEESVAPCAFVPHPVDERCRRLTMGHEAARSVLSSGARAKRLHDNNTPVAFVAEESSSGLKESSLGRLRPDDLMG